MSKIFLSVILFSAGMLHLFVPSLFDPAIPFHFKWAINLFAGILEILLALGLLSKNFQDLSARLSALWFLSLMPIHIYVSINHITIFGISNSFLLWIRTALQPVLYFWALSLQNKNWIMAQVWRDVLFLHYEVDPLLLQTHVPFKLDTYNNRAVVSIVSFKMAGIRFPFLPTIPGLSQLNELNLRTYVEVDGIKGVYFFTLDADLIPAIGIARFFFSLPYRYANIFIQKNKDQYILKSNNSKTSLQFEASLGETRISSPFDLWATERYGLFTKKSNQTLHGIVQHSPWKLRDVSLVNIVDNFSNQLGDSLKASSFIGTRFCEELKVRFRPFTKI